MMNNCQTCCTKIEHVSVTLGGVSILKDLSLHIHCNQITAIVGPNGAGKTTLFKTLLNEVPYEGKIRFVAEHRDGKKNKPVIGYVPQQLNFERTTPLTVLELFGICLQKRPIWCGMSKKFVAEIQEALDAVELGYALNRKIGMLSGGELQRVLLALALMPLPDILLLDEPISGVDVSGQKLFYERVNKLKENFHMGIIVITHDLENLETICDTAVLLNQEIILKGDPASIRQRAKEVIG